MSKNKLEQLIQKLEEQFVGFKFHGDTYLGIKHMTMVVTYDGCSRQCSAPGMGELAAKAKKLAKEIEADVKFWKAKGD